MIKYTVESKYYNYLYLLLLYRINNIYYFNEMHYRRAQIFIVSANIFCNTAFININIPVYSINITKKYCPYLCFLYRKFHTHYIIFYWFFEVLFAFSITKFRYYLILKLCVIMNTLNFPILFISF